MKSYMSECANVIVYCHGMMLVPHHIKSYMSACASAIVYCHRMVLERYYMKSYVRMGQCQCVLSQNGA